MANSSKASALSGFDFNDDEETFFNIGSKVSLANKSIQAVKGMDDWDNDEDENAVTDLEQQAADPEQEKPPVVKKKVVEEVDDEVEEVKPKKTKKEVLPDIPKVGDDADEDEDVEFKFDDTPQAKKELQKQKDAKRGADAENAGDDTNIGDEPQDEGEMFTTLAEEFVERGLFANVELPKDKKLTEDEFFGLHEKEIDARVEETLQDLAESMDDDGKAFIKFKKDGGRTADFIQTYVTDTLDLDTLDEADPKQVQKVLKYYIKNFENLDEDDTADRLEWLQTSGKEKAFAKKWFTAIKADETQAKEDLLKSTEESNQKKAENITAFKNKVEKVLKVTTAVGAFPISKKEQSVLGDFINKPTVKVAKNKYVPAMNAKLAAALNPKTEDDVKKLIVIAKLLFNDFDVTDFVEKAATATAKNAQDQIAAAKKGIRNLKTTGTGGIKKSLIDYF